MNNCLRNKSRYLWRFIKFLFHSTNRYSIHSPFVYDLIERVIRNRFPVENSDSIENLRDELLHSRESIIKIDYGSRAREGKPLSYNVKIRALVLKSVSSRRQAGLLYKLAVFMKARSILEFGTSLGLTSAYLGLAAKPGHVITLEGSPAVAAIAHQNLYRAGIDNVKVVEGRFDDMLDDILSQLNRLDLVFLDGDHRKEATLHYFNKCLPLIHNESVVVIHDIHNSVGMEEAWQSIRANDNVVVTIDLFKMGLVFFRKELSKQDFALRYF